MKGKLQFPVSLCWFLPVLVFMLVSCGDDDDYHYPSVKLDFLTAPVSYTHLTLPTSDLV